MSEFDLRYAVIPPHEWWCNYLAYLASTPRNYIERYLEPLTQPPGSHPHIIDHGPRPEKAPMAGMSVWSTIICLDGAPERMKYHTRDCRQSYNAVRDVLAPAEDRFRSFIATALDQLSAKPTVRILGNWHDGEIVGFETSDAGIELVVAVADMCAEANTRENLPWTQQFHVRAGIGLSLREAFSGLLHARCNQACSVRRKRDESSWGSIKILYKLSLVAA